MFYFFFFKVLVVFACGWRCLSLTLLSGAFSLPLVGSEKGVLSSFLLGMVLLSPSLFPLCWALLLFSLGLWRCRWEVLLALLSLGCRCFLALLFLCGGGALLPLSFEVVLLSHVKTDYSISFKPLIFFDVEIPSTKRRNFSYHLQFELETPQKQN